MNIKFLFIIFISISLVSCNSIPETGEKEVLFSDDGKLISAASTAIRYGDFLYVSQVFDNFVLKVKMN